MDFEFEGPVIEWRGPAPFYFVRIPEEESEDMKLAAKGHGVLGPGASRRAHQRRRLHYGALFPKDGVYLLPVKDAVRKKAGIELDQVLTVGLNVGRE